MRVAIYGRLINDNLSSAIQDLFIKLDMLGAEVFVYEPFYIFIKQKLHLSPQVKRFTKHQDLSNNTDFLLSLGGDGTFLDTLSFIRNSGIPVLGINTGRLGFLANVSKEEINTVLDDLIKGKYTLETRSLLRLETDNRLFGEVNYALNELTIVKKDSSSMITIHTYLNGDYLNSYWADGLIVSTSTGSTAYSLSCGGPIVLPESANFIITPIAPHNLNVRPLVISDTSVLNFNVEGRDPHYLVSLDSRSEVIDSSVRLTVKKEEFGVNLIKFENQAFLKTIRSKLGWGRDVRN